MYLLLTYMLKFAKIKKNIYFLNILILFNLNVIDTFSRLIFPPPSAHDKHFSNVTIVLLLLQVNFLKSINNLKLVVNLVNYNIGIPGEEQQWIIRIEMTVF